MGKVLSFHGARASAASRAAISANNSAVTPADCAVGVRKMGSHHSAGMLSRCGHLRAAATPAPISSASASGVGHKATTSRKVAIMFETLGRTVPDVKGIVSRDNNRFVRQNVLMSEEDKKPTDREWKAAFQARIREIQGDISGPRMAKILGIPRTSYSKIVGARMDQPPIRALPILAAMGRMTVEQLIDGPEAKPVPKPKPKKKRKAG